MVYEILYNIYYIRFVTECFKINILHNFIHILFIHNKNIKCITNYQLISSSLSSLT
jgi:hypothetical protein